MGNSGSFNLGVIGFDYNENGGGVTLGGIRIGGGKNGAEFGVNAAIGAEIDGKGLATGAQAKVAIGEQGVNATAKAKATAAAAEAGAAATAGVDYDGSTHADSGDTSSANVRFAEDRYNDAKHDLAHSKSSKERAEQDLILKRKALEDQRKIVHDMEEEQKKMEHSKVTAGQKKTECLKRKDQLLEELQSLENDVFWKKRKERKIERKQSRDNQINSAEEEEEEDGVVDQIAMEIAKLKNDIHAVNESITKLTEDIQELEKNLLDIAERIVAARTELDKAEQGEKEAEAHVAEAEEKYRLCEKDFKEAESNLEKTKSDRDREKKAQDMYRNVAGTAWTRLYFIAYFILVGIFVSNIVIAVIMEKFVEAYHEIKDLETNSSKGHVSGEIFESNVRVKYLVKLKKTDFSGKNCNLDNILEPLRGKEKL